MSLQRLLLLEDDPTHRALLKDVLELQNLQVSAFSSPLQFREANGHSWCGEDHSECGQTCFDYILSDYNMPGMSGLDFFLKQEEANCRLPRRRKAIISVGWSPQDLQRAQDLGYRVFPKPFRVEEILDWIEAAA